MKKQPVLYLKVNETDEELLEVVWDNERGLKWVIGTLYSAADIELFTIVDGVKPDTASDLIEQIKENDDKLYIMINASVTPQGPGK